MVWRDHGHVQSQDGINTPASGFGRRVAVPYGGKVYACSHHHKLAYQTQREQAHDRAGSRSDTIRKRLGWDTGILNGNGNKPKGIRRRWQWLQKWEFWKADSRAFKSIREVAAEAQAPPVPFRRAPHSPHDRPPAPPIAAQG
jgi:hypothetical protein